MGTLTIEVQPDGQLSVLLDGVPVGLLEHLTLVADKDGVPSVSITFTDPNMFVGAQRECAIELVRRLSERLKKNPFVEVFDRTDTLPSGMRAVRLDEE